MTAVKLRVNYLDVNGNGAQTLCYAAGSSTNEALLALSDAGAACSVGSIERVQRQDVIQGPDPTNGGAGAYSTHRDMLTLLFKTSANVTVKYTVVAPSEAVFRDDGETLDETVQAASELIQACLDTLTDNQENPVMQFQRGYRWRLNE